MRVNEAYGHIVSSYKTLLSCLCYYDYLHKEPILAPTANRDPKPFILAIRHTLSTLRSRVIHTPVYNFQPVCVGTTPYPIFIKPESRSSKRHCLYSEQITNTHLQNKCGCSGRNHWQVSAIHCCHTLYMYFCFTVDSCQLKHLTDGYCD